MPKNHNTPELSKNIAVGSLQHPVKKYDTYGRVWPYGTARNRSNL